MSNRDLPPIHEFDLLTAGHEIEMVTDELAVRELIIRENPKLERLFVKIQYRILEDPAAHFFVQ